MSTYGTLDKVRARLPLVEISSTSTPSQTQVQEWIDEAEDELNGTLRSCGLPAPYTDAASVRILGRHVTNYAEGQTRKALASELGTADEADGQALIEKFETALASLRASPAAWGQVLASDGGSQTTARRAFGPGVDTEASEPWFGRDTEF